MKPSSDTGVLNCKAHCQFDGVLFSYLEWEQEGKEILLNSAWIALLGVVTGATLKWIGDLVSYFVKRKPEFTNQVRINRIDDLFEAFPLFIQECKVQVQDLQYTFNSDHWLTNPNNKTLVETSQKEVPVRSEHIVELKERCSLDVMVFKNNVELRKNLNNIVDILDKEVPDFLKGHYSIQESDKDYVKEINKYRHCFTVELMKELDMK